MQLSSKLSPIFKFGAPTLLLVSLIGSLSKLIWSGSGLSGISVDGVAVFVVAAAYVWRYFLPLKDVVLEGDHLVVSNFRRKTSIPLSHIESAKQTLYIANVVHLTLSEESAFGRVIRYSPLKFGSLGVGSGPYPAIDYISKAAGLDVRPDEHVARREQV